MELTKILVHYTEKQVPETGTCNWCTKNNKNAIPAIPDDEESLEKVRDFWTYLTG